ncbi:ATP-binding protein [Herbivorax sp. ANBcel31]|uniref:ATP-binding protein n=1 Tax=Herbivorax sp. ANBcel31 TaxID=3069754 RepID=UPI0027B34A32|nr:ATP-binding protein [Herbivorax sp. ANBcel31]MDQ2084906.1 ATP-binding protein [Herbivorax sp. ANBcel31]
MSLDDNMKKTFSKQYLQLIYKVCSKTLNVTTDNYEIELVKIMDEIAHVFSLDRIYIYGFSDDPTIMKLEVQWSREGIKKKRAKKIDEPVYDLPWIISEIKEKNYLVINSIEELPEDAIFEKMAFQEEGVRDCIIIPIKIEMELKGFLAFEHIEKNIVWEEKHIEVLKEIAKIFTNIRKKIKKDEEYLKTIINQSILLDNSEAQLWVLKNVTVYGAVNEAHAKFFNRKKEEMEFQDLYDVFPANIADKLTQNNWSMFYEDNLGENELEIENFKGEKRLLLIKGKPKKDKYGNTEFVVCTAEDITEQKIIQNELNRAKTAAESASTMKSQFLANMSHEIRTPMNGILGFLDLLYGTDLSLEQKDYVKEAKVASEMLLYLINDILDFSKIEAGKLVIEETVFSIKTCVENVISIFMPKVSEKNIVIETKIHSSVPEKVIGDSNRLRQILMNLIGNAVKFTEQGKINIDVFAEKQLKGGDTIKIEVKDTGIGIEKEKINKLFNPFTQEDSSTTRKYGGTGLGLAISKKLLELMNGKIFVESELGKGSIFKVFIPFSKYKNEKNHLIGDNSHQNKANYFDKNKTLIKANIDNKDIKVLLVEDNEINIKVLSTMLKKLNIICDIAVNGEEAVEAIKEKNYDIVFMDCQMPVMDGYQATKEIRKMEEDKKHTIIVALTANAMDGDNEKCINSGMDSYLSKPVNKDNFLKVIQNIKAK